MTEALISTRRNGAFINQAFKLFRDAPLPSQFGFVMVWAYIFVAVFAPVLAPHAETEIVGDHYEAWSEAFPLGTDAIGRDMLSRMIYGARNTIGIAFLAASLGFLGGGIAGMLAAMLGGWTDQALSRVNDILMAIPGLIFILLVLSFLGTSIPVLVSVIGLFEATRVFRVTRAAATNVEVMEFVEVAKLRGENLWWLIRCVVLPNITVDPSRKSGGALHRLHCFCLEFDGACEVQRRVPTDWIIEPVVMSHCATRSHCANPCGLLHSAHAPLRR